MKFQIFTFDPFIGVPDDIAGSPLSPFEPGAPGIPGKPGLPGKPP